MLYQTIFYCLVVLNIQRLQSFQQPYLLGIEPGGLGWSAHAAAPESKSPSAQSFLRRKELGTLHLGPPCICPTSWQHTTAKTGEERNTSNVVCNTKLR